MIIPRTGDMGSASPTQTASSSRVDRVLPEVSLAIVFGLLTFLPNVVAPPKLFWPATAASVTLLAVALWRTQERLRWTAAPSLIATYSALATISTVHYGTVTTVITAATWGATAVLIGLLASNLDAEAQQRLILMVLCIAAAQLLIATGSAFGGLRAPWGYLGREGSLFRGNPLWPGLGGRATGTMAHPIPFGALMGVAALLSAFRLQQFRMPIRMGLAAGFLAGVFLSGTRSAALALVVATVFALLIPRATRHPLVLRTIAVLVGIGVISSIDVDELSIFTSLQGTGSVSHRAAALDAGLRLLDRPVAESVAGSGFGSIPDLFTLGYLQLDGFTAVDNQLVSSLATAGLLGLVVLLALTVYGLIVSDRLSRPAALFMFLMFFSFDVLQWYSATVLFFVLVCLGSARRTGGQRAGQQIPHTQRTARPSDT